MITALRAVEQLNLPQGCLCAGVIRNTVWDLLSGKTPGPPHDLDVIYFDPQQDYAQNLVWQQRLAQALPQYQWEVKNQVYMHHHNDQFTPPYRSVADALAHFPETCTAIAVHSVEQQLDLTAPFGLSDLVEFRVRPTPFFSETPDRMARYRQRVVTKKWAQRWPNLQLTGL